MIGRGSRCVWREWNVAWKRVKAHSGFRMCSTCRESSANQSEFMLCKWWRANSQSSVIQKYRRRVGQWRFNTSTSCICILSWYGDRCGEDIEFVPFRSESFARYVCALNELQFGRIGSFYNIRAVENKWPIDVQNLNLCSTDLPPDHDWWLVGVAWYRINL